MSGDEPESREGHKNGRKSPTASSRDNGSDRDSDLKWPIQRKHVNRSPSEEQSDYSEEKEDRRHPRSEEQREKDLGRDRSVNRNGPSNVKNKGSAGDVEFGSNDDQVRDVRKKEKYSSPTDGETSEDEVIEGATRRGRSNNKADRKRRNYSSEDRTDDDEVRRKALKKRKSSRREKSSRRHSRSDEDDSEEDEDVAVTPTKRSRSKKREKGRKHRDRKSSRRRHRRGRSELSDEYSSESEETSSSSDVPLSEDQIQLRKRRKKRRRKEKEEERESRRKERKRLKEKKLKSEKKKKKREMRSKQPITSSWGKYGILKDIDMWNKRPEFSAWLAEVKKVNMETLSNWEEKQLFKDYMEDYNTATFPSKKYYNLDVYHQRKMMKARMKGMAKVAKVERVDFNDEEQRRQELRREREQKKEEDVEALMKTMKSGMAQAMREQAQLREEMQYQFRLGNVEAAQAIQRRLDPDADKLAKM